VAQKKKPTYASGVVMGSMPMNFACSGILASAPRTPEEAKAERLAEYNMLKSQLQRMERDLIEDGILKDQRDDSEEFELRGSL
jgi:hypothetical protein